jgi:hypothetical protein
LPFSTAKFTRPEHLARFGFLIDPAQQASASSPSNLPVGSTHHSDAKTAVQYIDISCAA